MPDHRTVYKARCERPQSGGRGKPRVDKVGCGVKDIYFLWKSFVDDPLVIEY